MKTVLTETRVKPGREGEWDRAFRERAADARRQPGWIDLHLLVPEGDPQGRLVVGTWTDREAWSRWHETESFQATRDLLDDATEERGDDRWFDVIEEETADQPR
jgi:heme-degrading monooxygenase HmoA